jgi:hypothetical protein
LLDKYSFYAVRRSNGEIKRLCCKDIAVEEGKNVGRRGGSWQSVVEKRKKGKKKKKKKNKNDK